MEKCGAFTARLVGEMRERLKQLQGRVRAAPAGDEPQREQLLEVRLRGGKGEGGVSVR